jgi:hypothetical protein
MNALEFIKFCEYNDFIGFTFKGITTALNKEGIEKKTLNKMPNWRKINKENWKNFVNKSHDGFAIITGEVSGVSVLDFDSEDAYKEFLDVFGTGIRRNKVFTRKGKHLYFKYDPDLKQTQNPVANVDVRNDGGIIIAPPTSYTLLDGSTAKYELEKDFELEEFSAEMKLWCGEKDLIKNYDVVEDKPKKEKKSKTPKKKSKPIEKEKMDEDDITTTSTITTPDIPKKNSYTFLKESKEVDVADEINFYFQNGMFSKIDKVSDPYGTWLRIGAALKSELEYKDALAIFRDISKLYPKWWNEDGCEKKFNDLKFDKITIGSLFYYLKQEDEKKFKELKKKYRTEQVDLLNCGFATSVIADYFVSLYKNEFIYSFEVLYYWNGFYWVKDNKAHTYLTYFVDKIFTKDLTDYYLTKFKDWNEYCFENNVKLEDRKVMDALLANFNSNINYKLKNSHFRGSYLKDIIAFLSNDNIDWDNKPTLFVFENAVIDLTTGEKITPNPEDYLSISCGYNWEEKDPTKIKTLLELLYGIFPDDLTRHHYLEILSTGLCGFQQEKFFVATGKGGNGKSLLNALMLSTAGKYAYTLPSEFVLSPIKTGANPEVANLDGVRFALTQEPKATRRIVCSVIKEITGNPTINARALYSSKCVVNLRLTLVMECNDMPRYDEVGDAITRRNDITPFVSKAVSQEKYDETPEILRKNWIIANPYYKSNEFKCDYRMTLFHILLDYFRFIFAENKFRLSAPPISVKIRNREQMVASDEFYGWFDKMYQNVPDADAIKIKDIYSVFENSAFFSNLSKNDKRLYNLKYFKDKLENHEFIREFVFKTGKCYKKIQYTSAILIHHSFRVDEDNIIEDITEED